MKKEARVVLDKINKEAEKVMDLANTGGRDTDRCEQEYDNAMLQRNCANDQFFEGGFELSQYEDTLKYIKTLHKIVKLKKSLKPIFG